MRVLQEEKTSPGTESEPLDSGTPVNRGPEMKTPTPTTSKASTGTAFPAFPASPAFPTTPKDHRTTGKQVKRGAGGGMTGVKAL